MATKQRPRIGDVCYRVEWCAKLAFYEGTQDVDHDNCTLAHKSFPTKEAAVAFAESIYPTTLQTFGIVELDTLDFVPYDVDDAHLMPHAGFWECVESLIYSGEWESDPAI